LVKNSSNKVIRHAYIRGREAFTFNIPDGTYNIYFYSGTGWNPYKKISSTTCNIIGGFVSDENTGKDSYVNLKNNVLTYTLTLSTSGNFSMQNSSANEAFN
jgi:hypothetical protein